MTVKSNAGRKNKYFTHVKPRFAEISEWCENGVPEKDIINNLGIGKSAYYDYLRTYTEFAELVKTARKRPVNAIKAALLRRALGYEYQEKTVIDSENKGKTVEIRTKYLPPDPACAMILLKHWAKDEEWTNDPAVLAVRKEELELRKKEMEINNW